MLLRNTRNRYAVTAVAVCFVSVSLLTTVLMLVQHWGQDYCFGNVINGAVVARNVTGAKGVHVLSKLSISGQLPFVNVIVVATSALGWMDRRARIRTQFPRNMKLLPEKDLQAAILKFAVGVQGLADEQIVQAQAEAAQFSDLLLLDCVDEDEDLKHPHMWQLDAGVSSTTSKVMLSVQWAVKHYDFQYYFRLGDDSYFRVDKFVNMLSSNVLPMHNAVIGHIMTAQVFGMNQLYPQGMGYGLTYDVCRFIAHNRPYLLDTAPEDCVVARWLFAIGVQFVDSPLWLDIFMGDSCKDDMVLAHKLPAELWTNISEVGTVSC